MTYPPDAVSVRTGVPANGRGPLPTSNGVFLMTNLPAPISAVPNPRPAAAPPAWLSDLATLARDRRVVRLGYRRPGEAGPAEYLVEPYRLHRPAGGALLHAWQASPPPQAEGRSPWRDFRLDRIVSVADTGQSFEPRTPVTLPDDVAAALGAGGGGGSPDALQGSAPSAGNLWSDEPIGPVSPADAYFRQLEAAMLDGRVTPDELTLAQDLARGLQPEQRNAVHARILAAVLNEVAQDGRISHREEIYLGQVRELLGQLGWKGC